jgi:hypothetical protein
LGEHHHEADFEQGVMIDVGPGVGALVIYAGDEMRGQEIEISPAANDSQRVHTDVLRRLTASGHVCAAVFGSLAEGEYRLWHPSRSGAVAVDIVGGVVTELDWRR